MASADHAIERLIHAVREDAAFRRLRRLQPTGGQGDKIFPPTYPGDRTNDPPRHVFERRRIDGQNVLCVLIDSVQSQANRLEEALKAARDEGKLSFPALAVDFAKTTVADVGVITTLEAPHRVFDAIVRDSELDGVRFKDTDPGRRLIAAKVQNAREVFNLSPTALIFGAWNSTGEGGGLGAKFPRAIVSEIMGVAVAVEGDAPSGKRTGSRIDPLGIRSAVRVYKHPDGDWTLEPPKAKGKDGKEKGVKEVKPSEVNHSNIVPTVMPLGVSVDYAQHTFVLSLAALRRLRFTKDATASDADVFARAALAALGLASAAALDRSGYFLRSRCDLVPEPGSGGGFQIVKSDGTAEDFPLAFAEACDLLKAAVKRAETKDIRWRESDLVLKPQSKLVELVRQSREKALEGAESDSEE